MRELEKALKEVDKGKIVDKSVDNFYDILCLECQNSYASNKTF